MFKPHHLSIGLFRSSFCALSVRTPKSLHLQHINSLFGRSITHTPTRTQSTLSDLIPASLDPSPYTPNYTPPPNPNSTIQRRTPAFDPRRPFTPLQKATMTSPSQPYKLFVLENPLLDIQAPDSGSLLKKYNLKPNDAILAGPEHANLYDDLLHMNAKKIAGGAAQNTARGVQYISPPHTVLYVGAVGADDAANTLKEASKAAGLDTEYMVVPDVPTGRCGVVITGKDRSLCTDLGAANHYKIDHLRKPNIWAHAQAAAYFYVGGYHLTVAPDAAEALGKEAAEKGKTYVLNFSAPFIPVAFAEPLKKVLAYADIVMGNETEMACWAESQGWEESKRGDLKAVGKAIAGLHKEGRQGRTVIITQGTEPTLVVKEGEVKEYPVRKIGAEQIVDTNGAGDAFAGGFMAGLVEGKDVGTCVDMGQWLAALSIQELGPSFPKEKQTYTPTS